MKPLFIKKNGTVSKVSGIIMNLIPSYTLAEYNALTHKPLLWVRTDEEYVQISSEDVSYGSGSVKDALDGLTSRIELKSATFDVNTGTGSFNLSNRLPDGATPLVMVCNTTTSSNKHCKIDRYGTVWFGYVFNSVNSSGTAYTNANFNVTVFYV